MPPKQNPLGLNALQLKTLTLFQEIARLVGEPAPGEPEGSIRVASLPPAHGDHFHLGDAVVAGSDATGLANPAAWTALERKGLIKGMYPYALVVTPAGLAYQTGLRDRILRHGGH